MIYLGHKDPVIRVKILVGKTDHITERYKDLKNSILFRSVCFIRLCFTINMAWVYVVELKLMIK